MITLLEGTALPAGPALLEILVDHRPPHLSAEEEQDRANWTAGRIADALARRGAAHVLQEVRSGAAFDAETRRNTVRFASRWGQQIERLALVGEPPALRRRVEALEPLIGGEVRCFPTSERSAARRWLTAG